LPSGQRVPPWPTNAQQFRMSRRNLLSYNVGNAIVSACREQQ